MSVNEIMLSVSIVGLALILLICRRLAEAHPAKWDELGGSFWHQFRWRSSGRFSRFLFSREAQSLNDKVLMVQVWALRVIYVGATVLLLVLLFQAP